MEICGSLTHGGLDGGEVGRWENRGGTAMCGQGLGGVRRGVVRDGRGAAAAVRVLDVPPTVTTCPAAFL